MNFFCKFFLIRFYIKYDNRIKLSYCICYVNFCMTGYCIYFMSGIKWCIIPEYKYNK